MAGIGVLPEIFLSPQVQNAAGQAAGGILTALGSGLTNLFGDDDPPPPAYVPPPKPAIPMGLVIGGGAALVALLLYMRK